jgi:hypothetical protein
MRAAAILPTLCVFFAAACVYSPGAFQRDALRHRDHAAIASGCFEVRIGWRVHDQLPIDSTVIAFDIANQCQHPAHLDLRSMPLVARYPDARIATLRPFDPRHELGVITLDPYRTESFAVQFDNPWFRSDSPPRSFCLDVRRIDGTSTATSPHRFACLTRRGEEIAPAAVEDL